MDYVKFISLKLVRIILSCLRIFLQTLLTFADTDKLVTLFEVVTGKAAVLPLLAKEVRADILHLGRKRITVCSIYRLVNEARIYRDRLGVWALSLNLVVIPVI